MGEASTGLWFSIWWTALLAAIATLAVVRGAYVFAAGVGLAALLLAWFSPEPETNGKYTINDELPYGRSDSGSFTDSFTRRRASSAKPAESGFGDAHSSFLLIPEEQLHWFTSEVSRIYEVELRAQQYVPPPGRLPVVRSALEALRTEAASIRAEEQSRLGNDTIHEPLDDPLLGRLLVAQDFNVQKCSALLHAYVTFRRAVGGRVSPPPRSDARRGAFTMPFVDVLGRPVLFIRANLVDPNLRIEVLQRMFRSFMDVVILHFLWSRPSRCASKGLAGLSANNPLEQYVCVLDCEGVSWSNASATMLKTFIQETNVNFPDRLQEVIVLGVNSTVRGIWGLAAPMVHPRTRKKVRLVLREEVKQVMQSLVPFDRLPCTFGGNAPAFKGPEEATCLEEEVGAIAAAVWKHASLEVDKNISEVGFADSCGCYGKRRINANGSGEKADDGSTWLRCCFA